MSNASAKLMVDESASEVVNALTRDDLRQRLRQQEILAELGVLALQGAKLETLLNETVRLSAEGLGVQFSKVLRYVPEESRFLVMAGVGWNKGVVGQASAPADLGTPAGFALRTGLPVISNHLESEQRFRTSELLAQHGIRSAMNVILQGDGKPFGILEVGSRSNHQFVQHDLAFLQGAANVLGMAIERERNERHLKAALARQQFLVKEMNHRVKNNLAIVASLLQLQARAGDGDTAAEFEETARRVNAIARAHERLYRDSDSEAIDLGIYIQEVCQDVDLSVINGKVQVEAQQGIAIKVDTAISVALIVVELVTNSAKYAYPDGLQGKIYVKVERAGEQNILIAVRDDGVGLPEKYDPQKSNGLGMRIIQAFAQQLHSKLTFSNHSPGTEVKFLFPLDAD